MKLTCNTSYFKQLTLWEDYEVEKEKTQVYKWQPVEFVMIKWLWFLKTQFIVPSQEDIAPEETEAKQTIDPFDDLPF